ncbi:hypothetical protein AX16_010945 [Volvariella volvacea WC 439]|nr:hypothetical protein AX16_010945 [Volvariella volvacea WC 439]
MSTKTSLERINKLTGPNYREWADSMKAFLRSQGFWQLVVGNEAMVKEVPDDDDNCRELADNLKYLFKDNDTFHTAWTWLAEKFGMPNAAIVFGDFHKAMNFRISGNDNSETMMLLAAIPQKWDNVSMTLLAQYDMDGLTFDIINAAIAKKILAVKHREGDPKWKEQKSSGDSNKKLNKCGKHSGKHRNKGDKKENKNNLHLHAHSHLALAVHILDTFSNFTPTMTSNEIISPATHSLLEHIHDAPA